ncbi:MAG TPA: hypothetical protein VFB89_12535, partial [Gemmatimonadales bacterium]|nr:hypothetical protein [Gemmatimonadales bacterium]
MSTTFSLDISVIAELDSVLHSKVARAQTMLARLLEQLRHNSLESRAEVLVMYDETEIRPRGRSWSILSSASRPRKASGIS